MGAEPPPGAPRAHLGGGGAGRAVGQIGGARARGASIPEELGKRGPPGPRGHLWKQGEVRKNERPTAAQVAPR